MSKNTGGQAFPALDAITASGKVKTTEGMTLRDYFAGQALLAVITVTSAGQHNPFRADGEENVKDAMCRDAYELADAMLKAREAI